MPSKLAGLVAGLMVAALAPAAHAAPLQAGVAAADITPQNGGMTFGFVRPDIMVKGVHTRLMGRALVLDDGDTEVALLSTDLGVPFEKDSLVARVKDLGFTHETILYTGTHTHSGPDGLADWQVEQLARAIRKAHAERVPVRAAWGTQRVLDVNRNRSIEAHLANHGLDLFYGQGDPTDDPRGAEHARNTRLRILRVDRAGRHAARRLDPLPGPPDDLRARTSTSGTAISPSPRRTISRPRWEPRASWRSTRTARWAT